jgi:cytochrome c-type biogenesis protein CcsB
MKLWMKLLLSAVLISLTSTAGLEKLAVQDGGRVKPYDTLSKELLQLVHGKKTYNSMPATEVVFTWLIHPSGWQKTKFIEISYKELKTQLGFPVEEKYFSPEEILSAPKFASLMQELEAKRGKGNKLGPFEQSLQRLENQIIVLREMAAGRLLKIVPSTESKTWVSVDVLPPEYIPLFQDITASFVKLVGAKAQSQDTKEWQSQLDTAVEKFENKVLQTFPESGIHPEKIQAEVHYNQFHPFQWAWIFYLITMLVFAMAWLWKDVLAKIGWFTGFAGLFFHIYGFGLRVYLMGRAPVTNMYETVIWAAFGVIFFAMVIEAIYKWRFVLMMGGLVAGLCLILSDMAPAVLDGSLQPLEAVLRNNFWLLIHVLTITISYAAFLLAFALGNMGLVLVWRGEEKYKSKIQQVNMAIYRCIQIGVSFLAPGIILGGVWADYSWGRFWGWDPKETWALIVLLGYMAVLHARLAGWLKQFGMMMSAVLSFALVIMAWYGVNFVLGAGKHSYGFGAGGVEYVTGFLVAQFLFTIYVVMIRSRRQKLKV